MTDSIDDLGECHVCGSLAQVPSVIYTHNGDLVDRDSDHFEFLSDLGVLDEEHVFYCYDCLEP
jgi:hypothetical protein